MTESCQQNLLEAQARRRKAETFVNTCTLDEKPEAELKLAEAMVETTEADISVVEAELKTSTDGTDSHELLSRKRSLLLSKLDYTLKRLHMALSNVELHKASKKQTGSAIAASAASGERDSRAQKRQNIGPNPAAVQSVEGSRKDQSQRGNWQWCGDDGIYVDYSEEQSQIMDEKFESQEYEFLMNIQGQDYQLNLKRMEQTRFGNEGFASVKVRKLRRLCKELVLRPTWCNQTEPIETFPVLPQEADFVIAQNILFNSGQNATLTASAFEIVCVRRVQNQLAFERYIAERSILIRSRGAGQHSNFSGLLTNLNQFWIASLLLS